MLARIDEFRLDPSRSVAELDRVVRAGNPRPGAWIVVEGRRCKVWRAHVEATAAAGSRPGTLDDRGVVAADGTLALDEVQPEGKRRMAYADWRRGAHPDGLLTVDGG